MPKFTTVDGFLDAIEAPERRRKLEELLDWVSTTWPDLTLVVKWNQPMFTHHGVYIIGFDAYPKHIVIGPEPALMERMRAEIEAAGYTTSQRLMRIGWDEPVDHALLAKIIETQLAEKADQTSFWRP